MCEGWLRSVGIVGLVTLAGTGRAAGREEISVHEAATLLRKADFASQAPASLRARIRFTVGGRTSEIDVYRSSGQRVAVRFLDPKERGKWLVYRDGKAWFIAPGAKKPVKLPPTYRLRGEVSIEDLLGTAYSAAYDIASARVVSGPKRGTVVLELTARAPRAPYPNVRLVVERDISRPLEAEYRLANGREAYRAVFEDFEPGPPPRPTRIRLEDNLRPGKTTTIEILDVEPRAVPDVLFDLGDATARRALE